VFKKLLIVLMLLFIVSSPVYAQAPIYYQDSVAGKILPVSNLRPLPVDTTVTVGSLTVANPTSDEWATQTLTLVANTAQNVTSGLVASDRIFVELKAHNPTDVFWVDYGSLAVIEASRPCDGYVFLELPKGIVLSVIASTVFDIAVTEGDTNETIYFCFMFIARNFD